MRIKYSKWEAILIHEEGNKTMLGADSSHELLDYYKKSETTVRMILYKSTHNNTRLIKHAEYGPEWK